MSSNWARRIRFWGLVGLIAGDVAMLLIMGICGQWIWFTTFLAITLMIVIAECYSYFFTPEHITISTRYGRWIKAQSALALIALGLLLFAMVSLAIHLIGYSL
jgi:hypothetical protein